MSAIEALSRTITGARCLAIYAQGHVHRGEMTTAAGVLFLQFAPARWARFGIDAGHFHWREVASVEPIPSTASDAYPLTDVGTGARLNGRRIASVQLRTMPPMGAVIEVAFTEGGKLALVNADDVSRVEIGEAVV
jgi:hypothetical protein